KKMADDGVRFNLALSLHAADDEKRNAIMPINEQNNIASLMEALIYFEQKTKSEITFEYILMKEVNDSIEDAKNLVALCKQIPNVKVNLIEYNTVEGVDLQRSSVEKQEAFSKYLSSQRVIANIRRSRGKDIDAACGQLANKMK
ncbi:MAG TPA: 23S rRNA (adenine(2503)-C(2))-methyltransferase RlmN, partial [Chitinophagales bacterium]|nr:23S rRNA (adenine(2503)-C(2))-methyltransferase RlmN [Chitinophagales bacterium]